MADEIATPEQIAEYETQLENINQLLDASPNDESLLALKNDMMELLQLSKAALANQQDDQAAASEPSDQGGSSLDDLALPPPPSAQAEIDGSEAAATAAMAAGAMEAAAALPDDTVDNTNDHLGGSMLKKATSSSKSTKKQKIKEFVLPSYLIINDTDTEAEKNRKKRTAKALKNKWRQQKKEVESLNKQKSWQSFQKKTTKRKGGSDDVIGQSIFSTKEGVNDRVGVVSKKHMTEFGTRKRHKPM